MRFFKALHWLFPLALTGHATSYPKYSTWMLQSIISRGEGISNANGLLGGIQKVYTRLKYCKSFCDYYCCANHLGKGLFQEALRAAVESTNNVSQAREWSDYHSRSVQTGIDDFLNATADAKAPLDRLCAGRSLLFVVPNYSKSRLITKLPIDKRQQIVRPMALH